MTEISRPWAGTTVGDAGPYTAPNWWDVWQSLVPSNGAQVNATAANLSTRGVMYRIANRLAPTSPADNSVQIDTGVAFVDGLFYSNDTPIVFAVPSATAGNVRRDRIVLRKTFAAVTQTARLVRLSGVEVAAPGPGATPALTQDATRTTFFDLPICYFDVDDSGNITLTSEITQYVDAVQKSMVVKPVTGWNVTSGAWIQGDIVGIPLADNAVCLTSAWFAVPTDIVLDSKVTVKAMVYAPSAANSVLVVRAEMQLTEFLLHTGQVQSVALGQTDLSYNFRTTYRDVLGTDISNLAVGDVVSAVFFRYGNHANDNLASFLDVVGIKVDYLGWR